jgi:hypothetical protein
MLRLVRVLGRAGAGSADVYMVIQLTQAVSDVAELTSLGDGCDGGTMSSAPRTLIQYSSHSPAQLLIHAQRTCIHANQFSPFYVPVVPILL